MRLLTIVLALVALTLSGSAFAQDVPAGADLHAALHLRPDQQTAWRAYDAATATTPAEAERAREVATRLRTLHTPERLDLMVARMGEEQGTLARQAVAIKRLYRGLSPDQRRIFDALTLPAGP